jgi:regulator of nucleoside diphosphate kinase
MTNSREPPIVILKNDLEKLRGFASVASRSPVAEYLANELERALVVDDFSGARSVVRLGSHIRFRDCAHNVPQSVTLVMPNQADIGSGCISVLSPVGAALLGLSAGQEITFTLPNGRERSLYVDEVRNP